ncbi:MAG: hypothetical protein U1E52_01845 [Geminicoccaceae bacterium]
MTWRDINRTNMHAALSNIPTSIAFTSRGGMVLIGPGHTFHDQHQVAAGGRFFTRTGLLEITSPSKNKLTVNVTTDGDGDQSQLEDETTKAIYNKKVKVNFNFTVLKPRPPRDDD